MINKLLMTTLIVGAMLVPMAEAGPGKRQARQGRRIGQGIESGQLTRPEARALTRSLARNQRALRRDRVDGVGLTPRERAIHHQRQDRLNRRIHRQKHDGQVR